MIIATEELHILRTNLASPVEVESLNRLLLSTDGAIYWTVDLEDVDRVLRLSAPSYSVEQIVTRLRSVGILAEPLAD